MSDPKPFASLSSGLLARKGAARPAMRPQGFGQVGNGLDDLGWNDMGFDPPKAAEPEAGQDSFGQEVVEHPRALHSTGLSPVDSPVHSQQAEIADRFAADDDEEFDEEFDETAELYDPEAPFVSSEDGPDESEDEADDESETLELDTPATLDPAPTPAPFAPKKQMALSRPDDFGSELSNEDVPVESAPREISSFAQPSPEPVFEPRSLASVEPAFAPLQSDAAAEFAEPEPLAPANVMDVVPAAPAAVAPRRAPRSRAADGQKGKAAFTLRLDKDRHLKLRLACAIDGRSAQMLVTAALDQLLQTMPELQDMAEKANRKG